MSLTTDKTVRGFTITLYDAAAPSGLLSADVRDKAGYVVWALNLWVNLDTLTVSRRVQGGEMRSVAAPPFAFQADAFAYLATLVPGLRAEAVEAAREARKAARRKVAA